MATQVLKYSISMAAAAFSLCYIILVANNYEMDKARLTGTYWIAEFNVEQRGTEDRKLDYVDLSGKRVERTAGQIYADRELREIYNRYSANAWRFMYISLIPAALAFVVVFAIFGMVGSSLKEEEYIRGARLVTANELKAWSKRKWREYEKRFGKNSKKGPRYTLAGIEFPPNSVEAQIGITGTVGVGKTNAMHELLNTIREAGGRAIIYDRMGGLLRDHYDPEKDIILNPFDERSVGWSPFNEVTSAEGFAQIAEVMIPDHPGSLDSFWTQAARLVFQYTARELAKSGKTTNDELRKAIMNIPSEELAEIVAPTPGAHFFGEHVAKTSGSIRANMITELRFLEYLRDDADPFSIRDWVVNDRPGFVFLTGNAEQSAAVRNIVSTVFEVAANALMTTEESRDPKIWFFLDEVPTLNKLPFLPKSLAEIRQFGGAFVVGYQVFSQLEDIYGDKAAETISGVLNNRVVFNTPDYNTAQRSSRSLGEEDVIEQQENITLGANDTRDGVGIVGRRTQRAIVTPAEIQSLPQFVAYFRPAYDAPTAKVRFEPVPTKATAEKFIAYKGNGFDQGGMQVSAVNVEIKEGAKVVAGFASDKPQDQKAEFFRWLDRVRPEGSAQIEDPANTSERDWYWQHFATARVRGLDVKEIAHPDPYAGFAGNGIGQARETVYVPYPGAAPGPQTSPPKEKAPAAAEEPVPSSVNNQPIWRQVRNKAIFLDFDGVLHKGTSGTFNKLPLLEQFLRQNDDVDVVISSSWRTADQDYLERLFSSDLRHRLIGTTIPENTVPTRNMEIDLWAGTYGVKSYVALDDDATLFDSAWPHLLQTDGSKGLQPDDIHRLEEWIGAGISTPDQRPLPLSLRAHPAFGQTQPDRKTPQRPASATKFRLSEADPLDDAARKFLSLETAFEEDH
ncbi:type IV secretion system DNA-binding domain-containing protein [Tritonibacter scottomollicae]|uniref:type IV secretion system DNA-binding domain-containing protein n=1 Tax=Tritonibacter scottomollicae TaxID=483013 RepID=UPI002941DB76|nr:type IV secretion system DNA-binding domain-containing protein [Tritonibacter scottomollicae]